MLLGGIGWRQFTASCHCPSNGHESVHGKEGCASKPQKLQQPGPLVDQRTDPGHASNDQNDISQHANQDHQTHMAALQPLTQDKSVLGSNRHNEARSGDETGDEGGQKHGGLHKEEAHPAPHTKIRKANISAPTAEFLMERAMDLIHPQLAAFSAALDEGSFDAAAKKLSVTPSAVSQRVKALEDRLGQVLLVRQAPCQPTPAGKRLLEGLQPMKILEAEALADLHPEKSGPFFSIAVALAVNDDSLQTWVLDALSLLHRTHGYLFDVRVDDQDHTLAMLRDGAVLGAVTSQANPLKGCNVVALGAMRYRAIASPQFVKTHFPQGMNAAGLGKAPMLIFNRKDALQWRFVRRVTKAKISPPVHYLPSSTGFVDAARLGLGWCLAPEALIKKAVAAKQVVILDQDRPIDVPLYWQHSAVRSSTLQAISGAFVEAAKAHMN